MAMLLYFVTAKRSDACIAYVQRPGVQLAANNQTFVLMKRGKLSP